MPLEAVILFICLFFYILSFKLAMIPRNIYYVHEFLKMKI